MRTRFKPWAEPYLNDHPELVIKNYDNDNQFYSCSKLFLEIGTGKGDFILNMAKLAPEAHFIGIELSSTIAAIASKKLISEEIGNVRMCQSDATTFINSFPDNTFDAIFLNFSDPWPKKRHEKRRLTYPKNLIEYFRIIKNKGELILKTDNDDFFAYSLEKLEQSLFKVESIDMDYNGLDPFDAQTEYEKDFRQKGIKIKRIRLRKEQNV